MEAFLCKSFGQPLIFPLEKNVHEDFCQHVGYIDNSHVVSLSELWIMIEDRYGTSFEWTGDLFFSYSDIIVVMSVLNSKYFSILEEMSIQKTKKKHNKVAVLRSVLLQYSSNRFLEVIFIAYIQKKSLIFLSD